MPARSICAVGGALVAAAALTACGSSSDTPGAATAARITRTAGVVYEWGRVGGGLIGPGRAFGRVDPPRRRLHLVGPERRAQNAKLILGIGPTRSSPTRVRGIRGVVTQVATSNSTGYALTVGGAVYAWGAGSQGELGNATRTRLARRAVRVHFPAGVRISELPNPMPYNGAMAIDTAGHVWGWGNDMARNFCEPVGALIDTPVRIPLSQVTLAAGAWRHSIYDAGGRIVSCGLSDHGQLGDGTSGSGADTGTPVAVRGLPAGRVVALTSAFGNAGALMADGAYYDWGINSSGQLGDGSRIERTTAVRVGLPGPVRQVFAGGSFPDNGQTMALLSDGQLWVWGANLSGQLGDGTIASCILPHRIARGGRFVAVSSGGATDYAIGPAGDLWSWGQNTEGELGDGSPAPMSMTPVRDGVHVTQVSATARNVAALSGSDPDGS
jgi:alpha-tubulin suppressor-like RCC1 family protein